MEGGNVQVRMDSPKMYRKCKISGVWTGKSRPDLLGRDLARMIRRPHALRMRHAWLHDATRRACIRPRAWARATPRRDMASATGVLCRDIDTVSKKRKNKKKIIFDVLHVLNVKAG